MSPDNLAILYDDDVLSFFLKNNLVAGVYSIGADPIKKTLLFFFRNLDITLENLRAN
jgi:hypothetical protein